MENQTPSAETLNRYRRMELSLARVEEPRQELTVEEMQTGAEIPVQAQDVEIRNIGTEAQEQTLNVDISQTSAEKPAYRRNVDISHTSAENPGRPHVENSLIGAEKPVNAGDVDISHTSAENPSRPHVENSLIGAEHIAEKLAEIRAKLLAMQELLAVGGSVRSYWKNYRGKRLGPYYRVDYHKDGRRRSLYLGSDPRLAGEVGRLLENWQRGRRQDLCVRRLRKKIRASLRQEKANLQKLLAPLGFRMKGYSFHEIKKQGSKTSAE